MTDSSRTPKPTQGPRADSKATSSKKKTAPTASLPITDTGADSSTAHTQDKTPQAHNSTAANTPTQRGANLSTQDEGGVPSPAADHPPLPEESRASASRRWHQESRGGELALFRQRARAEYRRAHPRCPRSEAQDYAWDAAIAAFPPKGKEAETLAVPSAPTRGESGQIQGLADIPSAWPKLLANAGLQAEIGWVQANRLLIVKEKPSGATVVDLASALEPAPSRAALGWLETSIRAYSKYVDIVARSLSTQADEQQHVKRERMAIEAIRALLDEMHVDSD